MVNDHETGIVRYQDAYDNPSEGYWHGSLDHLQVGSGNGFLVSLMSQNAPAGVPQGSNLGQNVRSSLVFHGRSIRSSGLIQIVSPLMNLGIVW